MLKAGHGTVKAGADSRCIINRHVLFVYSIAKFDIRYLLLFWALLYEILYKRDGAPVGTPPDIVY